MKYKGPGFTDRLSTAADARKAVLAKFRAAPGPDDPDFAARQTAREAVAVARRVRSETRTVERAERTAREAAEAAQALQDAAEKEARDLKERAERAGALEIEQKAARDARYAARKKRGR